MSVFNVIEVKLYFFWKIVYNIESFIFSNGVLFFFGKKDFFCVCIDFYFILIYIFIILFVLVLILEKIMESNIFCLKFLFMYINFF